MVRIWKYVYVDTTHIEDMEDAPDGTNPISISPSTPFPDKSMIRYDSNDDNICYITYI